MVVMMHKRLTKSQKKEHRIQEMHGLKGWVKSMPRMVVTTNGKEIDDTNLW